MGGQLLRAEAAGGEAAYPGRWYTAADAWLFEEGEEGAIFADEPLPCEVLLHSVVGGWVLDSMSSEAIDRQLAAREASQVAASQAAIDRTVAYVKERKLFGTTVGAFQNTRFTLAQLQTEVQVARVFVDKCVELVVQGSLDTATASMAKLSCSELQCKVMDQCLQLYGGYGFMWEYPIARAYADARVQRIYGGTSEIMKEVISRAL